MPDDWEEEEEAKEAETAATTKPSAHVDRNPTLSSPAEKDEEEASSNGLVDADADYVKQMQNVTLG